MSIDEYLCQLLCYFVSFVIELLAQLGSTLFFFLVFLSDVECWKGKGPRVNSCNQRVLKKKVIVHLFISQGVK